MKRSESVKGKYIVIGIQHFHNKTYSMAQPTQKAFSIVISKDFSCYMFLSFWNIAKKNNIQIHSHKVPYEGAMPN